MAKAKIPFTKTARYTISLNGGRKKAQRSFDYEIGDKIHTSYEIFSILKQLHGYGIADFEIEKSYRDPYFSISELYDLLSRYWVFINKVKGITTLSADENKLIHKISELIREKFYEGFNIGIEEVKSKIQRTRSKSKLIKDPNDKAAFKELLDDILAETFKYNM